MHFFKNISLKHKIILVSLFTAVVALLLTGAALISYEMNTFKRSLLDGLIVQAEIIGSNSTAALSFKDQKAAAETLTALSSATNIEYAIIYAEDGTVFARYHRNDMKGDFTPLLPQKDSHNFGVDHVDLFHGIVLDGKNIGTIFIRSDLKELYSRLKWYTGIVVIIIGTSLFLSFLLSSRLHQTITKPVIELVRVMKTISKDKDYSIRAPILSHDEMGSLTEGFNKMLEKIQEREAELELHRKYLEEQVSGRTAELSKTNEQLRQREEELKKRVKELEEFYDMAVGREIRMIELKEEIEKIKKELGKYKNP